jgi:hypothetical protein
MDKYLVKTKYRRAVFEKTQKFAVSGKFVYFSERITDFVLSQ